MDYIQKIKLLREKAKISQVELSKMLGLSGSAYGLYETYQRQMDIATFVQICNIFSVSADELLDLPNRKEQNL